MVKTFVLVGILATTIPAQGAAQNRDSKYELGIRSAVITGTMNLSGLDPAFDDLGCDGCRHLHDS